MERQNKIEYISLVVVVGFFAAAVCMYILSDYLNMVYPYTSFLYDPKHQFSDFYLTLSQTANLDPYSGTSMHGEYPPFMYAMLYPFTKLNPVYVTGVYNAIFVSFLFWYAKRAFSARNTSFWQPRDIKNAFILSFLTYPFLFSFERGNTENILFLLLALTIIFYQRHWRIAAAFCLAVASAMKAYPLFLIILFFSEKRYKEGVYTLLFTAILTFIGLLVLKPHWYENISNMLTGLTGLAQNCSAVPYNCVHFNIGLWGTIKFLSLNYIHTGMLLTDLIKWYQVFTLISVAFIVFFVMFIEKNHWRKLALLILTLLLFPVVSNHYKLLFLLIPLAGFVNEKTTKLDFWYATLFALLFIPKHYYWFAVDKDWYLSINVFLTTGLVVLMLITLVAQGTYARIKARQNALRCEMMAEPVRVDS